MSITFPLDHSGNAISNLVVGEIHSVNEAHVKDYFFLVPNFAPFYVTNFKATLTLAGITVPLVEDVDYSFVLPYITGTRVTGKGMYGGVSLHNLETSGLITIEYQTLGGDQIPDRLQLLTELANKTYNPRTTIWDILTNVPTALPPTPHYQDYNEFYGQAEVVQALGEVRDAILANSSLTQAEIARFLASLGGEELDSYVLRAGDGMQGPLTLIGIPTENDHAVHKRYVDENFISTTALGLELSAYVKSDAEFPGAENKLDIAGGTMTGPLLLNGVPVASTQAVTKQYVDDLSTTVDQRFLATNNTVGDLSTSVDQRLLIVNNLINGLTPPPGADQATKAYIDEKISELKVYIDTVACFTI